MTPWPSSMARRGRRWEEVTPKLLLGARGRLPTGGVALRLHVSFGYYLPVVAIAGRKLSPVPAYLVLAGGYAFFYTTALNFNLVFQTDEAGLSALQLVLVGTALQGTIFFCEVPTGVLADVYSRRLSVVLRLCLLGLCLVV